MDLCPYDGDFEDCVCQSECGYSEECEAEYQEMIRGLENEKN